MRTFQFKLRTEQSHYRNNGISIKLTEVIKNGRRNFTFIFISFLEEQQFTKMSGFAILFIIVN